MTAHDARQQAAGRAPRVTGLLHRADLLAVAEFAATAHVRVIVGPPGSGKSVLLRQLAEQAPADRLVPRCVLGAEAATEAGLIARLAPMFGVDVPDRMDDLLDAITALDVARLQVHLDDVHRVLGTPGEAALARLLAESPIELRFVLACRDERVARLYPGAPRVGFADLRLRTWEVEQLFERGYRARLAPEAASALCDRVEGLIGAVRQLHLDTVRLTEPERAVAFAAPLAHSPRLAEFLNHEVLDPLPPALREFMVAAGPLGVLDGPLCDAALDRTGSHQDLVELTARQALTFRIPNGGGTHRFHVLLQQHLEDLLAQRAGRQLTLRAYRSAAANLADAGRWAEAYRCHARAGDWVAATALLHRFGAQPDWITAGTPLPATLVDDDPWVILADARRLRAEGRLAAAHDRYVRAEARLPDSVLRWQCARERSGVAGWLGRPGDPLVDDISGQVAQAVRGHPAKLLNRGVPAHDPMWTLGKAVAAVLDGRAELAIDLAGPLVHGPSSFVTLASRILVAVQESVVHSVGTVARFLDLADECEHAGWLWLGRLARAATATVDADRSTDAAAIVDECGDVGDEWGALLAGWLLAVGMLRACLDPVEVLEDAARRAEDLGARVPQVWLRLILAQELEARGDPRAVAQRSELHRLISETKLAIGKADQLMRAMRTPVERRPLVAVPDPPAEPPPPVVLRCLGRYTLTVSGTEIDLSGLRAQARRVLSMLTVHYGQPLHEEWLVTALWPDCPFTRTKHRLQVAISSLRALLRQHLAPEYGIIRHGHAYLLRLPPDSQVDVIDFAETTRRWRTARQAGDTVAATALGHRILDLYQGELLVEEGPAEWILATREAMRGEATSAAVVLAGTALALGDACEAIEVCERGVTIDDLDNRLWSLLAEARARTGNLAGAMRAERAYQTLVAGN